MLEYYWIKFSKGAEWQIVKFWTKNGKKYLKGLDWGSEHLWETWRNKNFIKGPKIEEPK